MTRILPVSDEQASADQKRILTGVKQALGLVPNLVSTLAHSPAAANAYLVFSGALARGVLSAKLREKLALVVAEANGCDYCLAAHCALGARAGLTSDEIQAARHASGSGDKEQATLQFAVQLVKARGRVDDADFANLRLSGCSDAEIAEIVAHVALNIFTNYFNHVAGTALDFPEAPRLERVGAH